MKNVFALLLISLNVVCQTVSRGPYLQQATPSSIIIKWKTSSSTNSKVDYGVAQNNLSSSISSTISTTDHEIKITGLAPYTKYFYCIGSTTSTLVVAASDLYFRTMPNYGQKGDYRFWVIGDAGTGDNNQRDARNAFITYNNIRNIDGWIWLGDNAYESGFNSEYQSNVFSNNTYENQLKNTVVWPAAGNHDYNNHIPFSPSPAYLDIFSLPSNGECGGVPSGSEKYYSYNYGNIHFIVLESYDVSRSSNGAMATWLQSDLNANTQPWVIAYWHHPPYTKGSHNSDNSNFLDGELVDIRQNIIPILEASGVDLVLNGHSHVYERSYLLDGHYGYSSSLTPAMKIDNTSGSYPTSCAYNKQTQTTSSHKGTVYVVCGCTGKNDSSPSSGWPHPAMYKYTNTVFGSMSVDVKDNKLEGKFITSTGTVFDSFTIIKNAGGSKTYTVCPNELITLKSTFPDQVTWFPASQQSDSITISTPVSTVVYATDLAGCIKDTFHINVISNPLCSVTGLNDFDSNEFLVYPSLLEESTNSITIESVYSMPAVIKLIDINGREIQNEQIELIAGKNMLAIRNALSSGIYFLKITTDTHEKNYKLYAK
jgi:acid phosphatase type 7